MKVYILNFLVYLMAMVGVIYISLMIFKRAITQNNSNSNNNLKIESSLNLGPRKTLHVINVNSERFLIASDIQNTTFLSKLNDNKSETAIKKVIESKNQDRMFMDELNNLKKIELKNNISVIDDDIQEEKSVFRELIQRL